MLDELAVKYFSPEDVDALNAWLVARKHPAVTFAELPAIGFMVFHDETPAAACFLRRCEGNYGIVDGLASNPECSGSVRHRALDLAIRMICEEARVWDITHLIAWSVDDSTLERSTTRHGFTKSRNTLLIKDLSDAPKTH